MATGAAFTANDSRQQVNAWKASIEQSVQELAGMAGRVEQRLDNIQAAIQATITAGEAELNRVVAEARQQFVASASSDA
eukprot:7468965-Lingulodinium_polyedra.AAC.1